MARENRLQISAPEAMTALAHPVRLDLINHLMASGPATASACARAVNDSPSNCSYHLRLLARVGLVEHVSSEDGRERPWRALVTGFATPEGDSDSSIAAAEKLLAVSVRRDERLVSEHLRRRDQLSKGWREAEIFSTYTLSLSARELKSLGAELDALIRPYLAATRDEPGSGRELVHLGLHAFPTDPR